jgi:hypothetical protein
MVFQCDNSGWVSSSRESAGRVTKVQCSILVESAVLQSSTPQSTNTCVPTKCTIGVRMKEGGFTGIKATVPARSRQFSFGIELLTIKHHQPSPLPSATSHHHYPAPPAITMYQRRRAPSYPRRASIKLRRRGTS